MASPRKKNTKRAQRFSSAPGAGVEKHGQDMTINEQLAALASAGFSVTKEEWYSGPIPPPTILEHFETIVPGSAQLIIQTFAAQTAHRQELERSVVLGGRRDATIGMVFAFIIAMTGLLLSAWLINDGHTIAGAIFGTADLLGLVSLFIFGRSSQSNERQRKAGRFR